MKKPNFFIIGAPKCGTTALATWLAAHPQIFMSPVKEPNYYNAELKDRCRRKTEYNRLFEGAKNEHYAIGEATVWYLYSQWAVPCILSEMPSAKLIVCLRNPVEMAYSLHGELLLMNTEHINNFRRAWHLQAERRQGEEVSRWCTNPEHLLYGPVCSLGDQMQRLYRLVSREQVLPVLLHDLKTDPAHVYANVLEFLEVSEDDRTEYRPVNTASERRTRWVPRAVGTALNLKRRFGIPYLGTGIIPLIKKLNRKPSAREPMEDDMKEELMSYFKKQVEILETEIERDLSCWKN